MDQTTKRTFPPQNDGTASVDAEGRAVIRFERALTHPIDRVWAAITEPDQIVAWFVHRVEIEPRAGGRLKIWTGDSRSVQPVQTGTIQQFEPPRLLEADFDDGSTLRFELRPAEAGCVLVFTDTRPPGQRAQNSVFAGWHLRMDQLPEYLEGRKTDWLALDHDRDPNGYVAAIAEIYWHYRERPRHP